MKRITSKTAACLLTVALLCCLAAVDPLAYRDRGNRKEGVRGKPVSGFTLELLGAMVSSEGMTPGRFPASVDLEFYLEERAVPATLTLRERHPRTYYWLDQPKPPRPWRAGGVNHFSWPSGEVLAPLGLQPRDLVALVRLGRGVPGVREWVAPVRLDAAPGPIARYAFTFQTHAAAKLRSRIYAAGGTVPVWQGGSLRRHPAAVPFEVVWPAKGVSAGHFTLVVEGYFLQDNTPLRQEVIFYHRPNW